MSKEVIDGKQKQEIEYLISKIEQEEEELFTGVITIDDLYNGSDIEIHKKQEEERLILKEKSVAYEEPDLENTEYAERWKVRW